MKATPVNDKNNSKNLSVIFRKYVENRDASNQDKALEAEMKFIKEIVNLNKEEINEYIDDIQINTHGLYLQDDKWTLLHNMAQLNVGDICKYLLTKGADPNKKSSKSGITPLHIACSEPQCELKLINLLINHGADINAKENSGETPILKHLMLYTPERKKLRYLIENGANCDPVKLKDETKASHALNILAKNNLNEEVALAVEKGANPNSKNEKGETPLYSVISASSNRTNGEKIAMVKTLLSLGADPNSETKTGGTPLHACLEHWWGGYRYSESLREEHLSILKELIHAGGDIHKRDIKRTRLSPLKTAEQIKYHGGVDEKELVENCMLTAWRKIKIKEKAKELMKPKSKSGEYIDDIEI